MLARGSAGEPAERATYALKAYRDNNVRWLLDIALDQLTAARAALAKMPGPEATPALRASFRQALADLRAANQEGFLPPALLAHAEASWRLGDIAEADDLLAEAEDIAARGPMPLFAADAALLRARIALAANDREAAQTARDAAAALIARHEYGGRVPDLALLDAEMEPTEAGLRAAITAVRGEAFEGIDGGWWGLLPRLDALLAQRPDFAAERESLQAARDAYVAERTAHLLK